MIRIFKIDLLNGKSNPMIRSFACDKVIGRTGVKAYKKRLKSVFGMRYNKKLEVNLGYTEIGSVYPAERSEK